MSELRGSCCAGFSGGFFNCSIGVILVLFILLVIISRSWGFGC